MGVLERTPRRTIGAYLAGDLRYAPEGGESYVQLTQRVLSFLVDLIVLAARSAGPLRALVSTHVGPMRIIYGILEQRRDARDILKRDFDNVEPYASEFRELKWPRFLAREEVLNDGAGAAGLLSSDESSARQELPSIWGPPY
jgi:broad specificity phosphatase PhoE